VVAALTGYQWLAKEGERGGKKRKGSPGPIPGFRFLCEREGKKKGKRRGRGKEGREVGRAWLTAQIQERGGRKKKGGEKD